MKDTTAQPYPLWVTEIPDRDDLWDLNLDEILAAFVRLTHRVVGWTEATGEFSDRAYLAPLVVGHGPAVCLARSIHEGQESAVFYAETRREAIEAAYRWAKPSTGARRLPDPGSGQTWQTAIVKALAA